jgi:hypothetical protein
MSNGLNPQRKQVFCYDHVSARLSFNSEPVVYCIRAKKSGGLPSFFAGMFPGLFPNPALTATSCEKNTLQITGARCFFVFAIRPATH